MSRKFCSGSKQHANHKDYTVLIHREPWKQSQCCTTTEKFRIRIFCWISAQCCKGIFHLTLKALREKGGGQLGLCEEKAGVNQRRIILVHIWIRWVKHTRNSCENGAWGTGKGPLSEIPHGFIHPVGKGKEWCTFFKCTSSNVSIVFFPEENELESIAASWPRSTGKTLSAAN